MRILLLNYEFPPLGGGAANATYYLLREFAQDPSLTIDLITSSVDTERVEQFAENIRIFYEDIGKKGNVHFQSNNDLLQYSWKAFNRMRALLKTEEYALVHAFFGIPCGFIAKRFSPPYIVSLRGSDVPFYNPRFKKIDTLLFQRLSRRIWSKAEAVIANSQQLAALAHQTLPELEIPIIQNGVDTEQFTPNPSARDPQHLRIVSVSRLIERKGIHLLVTAFTHLAQTHENIVLNVVGDGDLKEQLQQQVEDAGLTQRVFFHGAVAHNDLPAIYQQADIFVLPSQNEGMSNTALEALASGLPLILTNTGGANELVNGNGTMIPVNDGQALERALDNLISSPELREQLGAASRKKSAQYSWKAAAEAYKAVYINSVDNE